MSVLLTASVTAYANDGDGQPSVAATEKQNEEQSVKPHWEVRSKRKYYIKSDGKYAKYWNSINGYRYYFNSNGQLMTGWLRCKGAWYYLNDYGVMAIGWRYINYKWYYFNQNGVMATYSRIIDGKRYYFYGSGAMHTGWLMIKGLWYYFYNSGAMATDTWIGGTYYVNSNGAWIYNKKKTVDVLLGVRRRNVVSWLSKHEKDRYYLGTPYAGRKATTSSSGIYGWNPTGCIRPYGRYSGSNPGMNCAGFVADVMAYSGAGWSRVEKIGTRSKSYIAASAWYDYVMANNAEYYYFSSIGEALKSGKLKKGDIVYFKAVSGGKDKYGNPSDSHIGFFWGDTPSDNKYWHSSWNAAYGVEGAGTLVNGNQISVLSPFCVSYVYVFPLS